MSYSFSVSAASKAEAKQKIAEALDGVVAGQAFHAKERSIAEGCAGALVDKLDDPTEGEEIHVAMHGSIGWKHDGSVSEAPESFTHANVGVNASVRPRP